MDRGLPTEETLNARREADPPVHYLVGTPRGRLTQLEKSLQSGPGGEDACNKGGSACKSYQNSAPVGTTSG